MLPKPEKNKKTHSDAEQLDLVDALSKEDKVAKKRRYVLLFLIATVGLSFGFWSYRTCRYYISSKTFPHFDIKIPQIQFNKPNKDLNAQVSNLIAKDGNHWSIYVKTISTNKTPFLFTFNTLDINDVDKIFSDLNKLAITNQSITQANLPQGIKVQENINSKADLLELNSLITVPQKQIMFIFKINGNNLDQAKKTIPSIIELIYWQLMNTT